VRSLQLLILVSCLAVVVVVVMVAVAWYVKGGKLDYVGLRDAFRSAFYPDLTLTTVVNRVSRESVSCFLPSRQIRICVRINVSERAE
jgi:hypothetical protein